MDGGQVVAVLVVVGLIALIVAQSRDPKERAPLIVGQPPAGSIEAVTAKMAQDGFSITYKGETSATFARPKTPDAGVGCLLLLLGLIPGLLYFGLFKGTLTTSVTAMRSDIGTQLIISGDDEDARDDLTQWVKETLVSVN